MVLREPDVAPRPSTSRPRLLRPGPLVAGLALVAVLVTVRLLAPADEQVIAADAARDAITLAISVLIESLPFVFLGILLAIVVQLWVPERVILRLLPRTPWLRRATVSVLGVVLPVCECGNVPLARGLMVKGLTVGESMTFLAAAPILNPVTIITTYQAFGWEDGILVARIAGGFAIANLLGWVFSRHPSPSELLTTRFQRTCAYEAHSDEHGGRMTRALGLFARETSAMLPALFVGAAIAGLIQVVVSRDLLVTLGSNPLWSVLALMALAFVIAICSNVDAFFILAFGSTFLPGAIVAFLVFGAIIDVKMLSLLRTTFSTRTLAQLTALVALCALALGLGVNLLG
ncbi:permease [Herbiconiux sp. SYSU D00978]|uniref:permease n=1 Tax=Herbiconiux sp. SYSU D00978 TaxID=2812562 RepID=UPI001A973871|nr:permease [Herbiconiux sp. SYSU D00978]